MLKSKFLRTLFRGFLLPMCFMLGVPDGGAEAGTQGAPAGEAAQGSGEGTGANPPPVSGEGTPKTFTQEDLNRIGAKEKAEGRRALLKELGIEDTEDARSAVASYVAAKEAQKTEAQKATERAQKAELEKATAVATATSYQQKFDALAADALPDTIDDLLTLVNRRVNDKTDFKAALEAVKAGYPAFFKGDGTPAQKRVIGTGGSANPPKGTGSKTSVGERLAKSRLESAPKENPFFNKNI